MVMGRGDLWVLTSPDVESKRVELCLNLVWAALAVVIVCLWFRQRNGTGAERRMQWIALAVLIAILFPVISVSDDLLAVQNASETDGCLRRDHLVSSNLHPVMPTQATVPPQAFGDVALGFLRFVWIERLPPSRIDHPERAAIQNRPPPAA